MAALATGTIACELIVGIGDQPHLAGDAGPNADAEAGPVACTLPTTGDAKVRLANLVPTLDRYDFCLTPTNGAAPTAAVLASSGSGCPPGLLYRNVLAPFAVPSGSYRVDAVAPGTPCGGATLASAPSVNFDPSTTTTMVLFGTAGGAQLQLKAFREEEGTAADPKVRFVNGWSDGPSSLECGLAGSDELPTTISGAQLFAQNAIFGNIAAASASVDPLGYFSVLGGVTVPFAFAETGKGSTGVTVARDVTTFGSLSMFAIGTSADPRFPVDLMICNQDQVDGIYTRCSNQVPYDVIVDDYNVQLQGRFTPTEADRRSAIQAAVASLDGDFACITEVWDPADKQAIIDAAKPHFPYVARFTTDETTVPNDPRDQQGNVPPAYTTPPCDATSGGWSQQFLDCLAANCTTGAPNDPNGQLVENATQCVVSNCLNQGIQLIADAGCYSCDVTHVESGATFAATQTACTTDPLARFAFNGDTGIILLSTHPFLGGGPTPDAGVADGGLPPDDAPGLWVLPSTEYRAAVIRAPVDLSAGTNLSTKLDVYCAILTTPASGAERPYTGNYGGSGATDADKWLNENILQGTQLASFVSSVSGARKRRAIVAGDFYSGPALGNLQALNQASYDNFTKTLPLAIAPGYTPACTFCGDNPLVNAAGAGNVKNWSSYSLLGGLAVPEVQSNTVVLTELTATTNLSEFGSDAGTTLSIPPSFYYGMRTVVRVRP